MRGKNQLAFLCTLILLFTALCVNAQLKTVIEDFEGYGDGQTDMKEEGIFSYGGVDLMALQHITKGYGYSGQRALEVKWQGKQWFGGWGVGIGMYKELSVATDYFTFYLYCPKLDATKTDQIKITLEDDDTDDDLFDATMDDQWIYDLTVERKNEWQLIAIPLNEFKDGNKGGDGNFNLSFKYGKLLSLNFSFEDVKNYSQQNFWYFDFIAFSKGRLPLQKDIFMLPPPDKGDHCALGAWSKSRQELNYLRIAKEFEALLNTTSFSRKLSLASFYKPFSVDGKNIPNVYPSKEELNTLITNDYLPLITLEAHYAKAADSVYQPNLYAIVEGHLDYYFADWARRLKQTNGPVFLRVLHEFNGDWYPWCISKNGNDPELFVKAFRHIRKIFWDEKADNVKFVWCPNSMSLPQKSWNFIMDAYPGNEYVDVVGMDVFNGAGEQKENVWHSFRKAATDNYFIIKEKIPNKPFVICETSSRERLDNEIGYYEGKNSWIEQQAEALKTDFSKINMMIWFNQYDNFKVNSSPESLAAFFHYFWSEPYFIQQ